MSRPITCSFLRSNQVLGSGIHPAVQRLIQVLMQTRLQEYVLRQNAEFLRIRRPEQINYLIFLNGLEIKMEIVRLE